jgi:fumarate reductase (CoM/CoB) subunit A
VILATGGAGELFPVNSNTPDSTGDGYTLALDAGADLVDMEFILMLGHAVLHPVAVRGVLYTFQYLLPKGGAPLYNAEGEPFLSRYDPEGSDNPARHIYARAIYGEVRAGRGSPHGGAWFDPASVSMETLLDTLPSQTEYLMQFGVDMRKPIEVGVAAHYICGGVKIGPNAETSLRGLYAVGECSGGVHGAARIGGNSLSELLVFGKRAGRYAAEYAATAGAVRSDGDAEEAEYRRVLGLLDRGRDGPRPTEVKRQLQETMDRDVGVVRNEAGLSAAIATLEALEARTLPTMAVASDDRIGNYDWIEALEVSSMVRLGRAIAGAARLRTESRGAHYREDKPSPDDGAWRRNILINADGGEIGFRTRPAAPEHLEFEKVA